MNNSVARTHILVVDDEPQLANTLADFIRRRAGYEVTTAGDGSRAVRILTQTTTGEVPPIDLVVMDMRMPRMTGLEVLNWLRKHPTLAYTRVIMLTAASGDEDKVDALSAGADDYIVKPYHPQELLARVNTILRTQQLEKQLQRQSEQLAALNRASNAVTTSLDIRRIPQEAVQGVRDVLGVAHAALFIRDREQHALQCQALAGPDNADGNGHLVAESVPLVISGQGVLGRVYSANRLAVVNAPQDEPVFVPEMDAPPGVEARNLMALPLVVRSQAVGVLVAYDNYAGPFNEVDVDLFASLGGAVSRAIENATLFRSVKARQQELQESHNRLQAVMDGILNPIYTINENWQLVAVNKSKADELGVEPELLIGRHCYAALFGRESPCEHCQVARTLGDKQARRWSLSWVGVDHLAQEWDIHAYPIPSSQAEAARAVVVWQDRTEERRLENSLLQAAKLAAIGQLAAGVAHEINNPLTAINANAQILKMFVPEEDENFESVDLIARAGERAANVVRNLLDFARQSQYTFEEGDVNRSIDQALSLVSYQLDASAIAVRCRLSDDLPSVYASWEHLKTVWLNLLINARDALVARPRPGKSGEITIETRLSTERGKVQVLISDNGIGMSEAQLAHIFEPFYTTKEPGRGTGLGLATSQRVVQQHGGQMEVVSRSGDGTTFVVYLPVSPPNKESETSTVAGAA